MRLFTSRLFDGVYLRASGGEVDARAIIDGNT